LPPGKYQFNYRAKGKDGIWSYYKAIEFEIEKPLWLRTWFIVMVILSLWQVFIVMKLREKALKTAVTEILERSWLPGTVTPGKFGQLAHKVWNFRNQKNPRKFGNRQPRKGTLFFGPQKAERETWGPRTRKEDPLGPG